MHLYIHVPFCRRRCSYCDFAIAVRREVPGDEYVRTLSAELALARGEGRLTGPLKTVYLGGGTPSLLPPSAVAALIAAVATPLAPDVEITLEANPEDVTPESARAWRDAGVNRVSLGAQSFDDRVLEWMHRPHDAARIPAAVDTLRSAGIENLSLDLIFALPAELNRDWTRDLDRLCELQPAHCSLYGLTIEPRTPLERWIARGATSAPDDARYAAEYLAAHERLGRAGLEFYEVSNAARDGRLSRHNSAYWSGASYVGVGPAAHSFDGRTRRWNIGAWEAYRRAVADGRSPVESEEVLAPDQQALERLYLGLRTVGGVTLSVPDRLRPSLSDWSAAGWVVTDGDRLRCTPQGWLRLDGIVARLAGHAA